MDLWCTQVLDQEVSRRNHANSSHGLCSDGSDEVVQKVLLVTEGLVFGSRNIRALCERFRLEGDGGGHAYNRDKLQKLIKGRIYMC